MSGRIPSRAERLRPAEEAAERIKDQWANANDVFDDVRDLIHSEDPTIGDNELLEAVERRSAETLRLEEEKRGWQKEIKLLKEQSMRYEQEILRMEKEMQLFQLLDEEPEEIMLQRLKQLKRLIEDHPKLPALLFEDKAIFQPAIHSMRTLGNQLLAKLHNVHDEVNQLNMAIHDARIDYHARLDSVLKPLQNELVETRKELESTQCSQSMTDTELSRAKEIEPERVEMVKSGLEKQVDDLQVAVRTMQLEHDDLASQIKELTARNQQLETEAVVQSDREQQLQRVVFSDVLSHNDSLSAADIQLFFKQQTPQLIRASWIMEPFGHTLEQLTNSPGITASLVNTYQLALQGLCYVSTNNELPNALLSQLKCCQKWLTMVCNHTSILGLALDSTINAIEKGTQPEP